MTKAPLFQAIAAELRAEIAASVYRPGDRLPTEAELAARFGVNRHTVRRALLSLAEAGALHSRRGAGVFVASPPTEYPLGERVRFHQNLLASGRSPSRRFLHAETRRGTSPETEALQLAPGALVHVVEGISLADGTPVAHFRSVFPALPGLLAALEASGSVTEALRACGIGDYTRAQTRIAAELAGPLVAGHLRLAPGAPVLTTTAVNIGPDGVPVEYGVTHFAADRVVLTHSP